MERELWMGNLEAAAALAPGGRGHARGRIVCLPARIGKGVLKMNVASPVDQALLCLLLGEFDHRPFRVQELSGDAIARIIKLFRPDSSTPGATRGWLGRRLRQLDGAETSAGNLRVRLVTLDYSEGSNRPARYRLEPKE